LDWKGRQLWIVSREGLIKLKEAAKRPKDILDPDNLKAETK
jgi:ABC-type metal ion transport system substrate-binding protein